MFLEHTADAQEQDIPSNACSDNMLCKPQHVSITLFGGPIGHTGRFAAARLHLQLSDPRLCRHETDPGAVIDEGP
eukprot:7642433-Pyramimonas_sp.AAC.1